MADVSNRPLRVAMLTDYPLDEKELAYGGVINAAYWLTHALSKKEDLHLFVLSPRGDLREEKMQSVGNATVVFFPMPSLLRGIDHLFRYRLLQDKINKYLKAFQADIIHAQGNPDYIVVAVRSMNPHVVTMHGIFQNELPVDRKTFHAKVMLRNRAGLSAERWYLPRIKNLIAITGQIQDIISSRNKSVRVFRINNPLDDSYFSLSDKSQPGSKTILFMAAIRHRKGLHVLLEAFDRLIKDHPDAVLHVIGTTIWDSNYVNDLKVRFRALIEGGMVVFFGSVPQDIALEHYEKCSLLCLPSLAESQPMVIMQAFAAGKPAVATRVGGIPEMVFDGDNGLLVEPGNVEQTYSALRRLFDDPLLRRKMGENARRFAKEQFSMARVADQTLGVYRAVAFDYK